MNTATLPPPTRENGGLAFDPISNELVLAAGYARDWVLHSDPLPQPHKRGVKH